MRVGVERGRIAVTRVYSPLQFNQSFFLVSASRVGRAELYVGDGSTLIGFGQGQKRGNGAVVVALRKINLGQAEIHRARSGADVLGLVKSGDRLGKSFL